MNTILETNSVKQPSQFSSFFFEGEEGTSSVLSQSQKEVEISILSLYKRFGQWRFYFLGLR
jgi:hypothetical protein